MVRIAPLLLVLASIPALLLALGAPHAVSASALDGLFVGLDDEIVPSGILLDRALPLAALPELDGRAGAPVVDRTRWRQAYFELRRAGASDLAPWTSWWDDATKASSTVPVGVLDFAVERLRGTDGLVREGDRVRVTADAVESARVFAAAALVERGYDARVTFDLGEGWRHGDVAKTLEFDAADGLGWRRVPADGRVDVVYATTGERVLSLRTTGDDVRTARFSFEVVALAVPAPEDTIRVVSPVAFEGEFAAGDAYVYLAPGRTAIEQPLIFVEGLDLDDTLGRDELYMLLNGENLLEDFRAMGYDVLVLNFDDGTTYVQSNGLLVAELVQEVQRRIAPTTRFTLAGASMGGVCSRYALAWLEEQGIEHRVDLFVAFDAPHRGANIPIGLQFWVDFFRDESAEAEFLASRLDRPAPRQLLVYHYRAEGSAGFADPLRAELEADLAFLGGYPSQPRRVAVANGSGVGIPQSYGPGQQLLAWEHSSFLVGVTGNVWAVGDGPTTRVFEGEIRAFLIPISGRNVNVTGTEPYDNAPGGTRASMQQAADVDAPYGDIVALHPAHDFIPTVSALDLPGVGILEDVSSLSDPAALSPFDAVYAPTDDQEHVLLTAENAAWFRAEVLGVSTDVPDAVRSGLRLVGARPNPFNPRTTIEYAVDGGGAVRLAVYDLRGRHVRTLVEGARDAGRHRSTWDGRDADGSAVASGVYLLRLDQGPASVSGRIVLVR